MTMPTSISLSETGTPAVLTVTDVPHINPGPGEVWLEQQAIGVNYLDVMQRKGTAPLPLPNGLGLEAAGTVVAIGDGVIQVQPGDRVAYILGPVGAYASHRLYPANRLVKLPETVSVEDAAAILFKGMTAQYLLKSTYPVGPGTNVLIYGAAGALGQIMCAWARALGAFVMGVVSREESRARATAAGCQEVLLWGTDLAERVATVTEGAKTHVVYDGVGRDSFAISLDCLRPRGLLASIGASSGQPPAVEMATLNAKGSLFVTRPGLAAHATELAEYQQRAADVFAALEQGIIRPNIWRTFPLQDVADVHGLYDRGQVDGTIILKP